VTGKERLTRASFGKEIDRVPWTPMLYQYFYVRHYNRTLPPELSRCTNPLEAMRALGADLFAKHEAYVVRPRYSQCSFNYAFQGAKLKQQTMKTCINDVFGNTGNLDFEGYLERHDSVKTPQGELRGYWRYDEDVGAPFKVKEYWTDFDREFPAVRALLTDIEFTVDKARWARVMKTLGNDGIAHVRIPPTPLKILHWLAGLENTVYFHIDHPHEIAELVAVYERKRLALVKEVVSLPGSVVFTSGDNTDTLTYAPDIYEELCGHSFRQISEIIHQEGKVLFTHACGQLRAIIDLVADCGVDGVEGVATEPIGDLRFGEVRNRLGPRFILQGGMRYLEEEDTAADAKERIFGWVQNLFEELGDKRGFILSSGCCTPPEAVYNNLLAMRDACWKYGKFN